MEERKSLLAGREQHDQNRAEKPKIHLFVTPTEVTFLTDEEYKLRTQPDEQVIQSTAFASDHERLSQLQTQPLVPLKQKASKSWLLAPGMVLLVNVALILVIFFLDVLPILTQSVTVTIIPKSQAIHTTQTLATVQSRVLPPLTLSKTQTVNATGKRHQDATAALGTVTFYNGLFTSQEVPAGTILTGTDGVQIVTDQAALIPPLTPTTPPTDGNATVQAHAVNPGAGGNIAVRDMNAACCGSSIIAQNTVPFQGGQNERNYTVVIQDDIDAVHSLLAPQLNRDMHTTLLSQLVTGESLIAPSCASAVSTDHQIGEEATTVTVTLAEHCTGVAFTPASLQQEAQQAAAEKVQKTVGGGYSLIGVFHVTPQKITVINGRVYFTVSYSGVWIYQLSTQKQHQLIERIAGKRNRQAVQLLSAQPGIQTVSISGIDKNEILPKDFTHIHVLILYFPN